MAETSEPEPDAAGPYYREEHGAVVLTVYDDQPVPEGRKYAPDMRVTIERPETTIEGFYPSYRIWTLVAHWKDDLPAPTQATR